MSLRSHNLEPLPAAPEGSSLFTRLLMRLARRLWPQLVAPLIEQQKSINKTLQETLDRHQEELEELRRVTEANVQSIAEVFHALHKTLLINDDSPRSSDAVQRLRDSTRQSFDELHSRSQTVLRSLDRLSTVTDSTETRCQQLERTTEILIREKESIEHHLARLQSTYDRIAGQESVLAEMRTLMRDIQQNHTELARSFARQLAATRSPGVVDLGQPVGKLSVCTKVPRAEADEPAPSRDGLPTTARSRL